MQFAVFAKQKIGQCPIAKLPSDAEGVGFHRSFIFALCYPKGVPQTSDFPLQNPLYFYYKPLKSVYQYDIL